jgi:phage shock protein E
MSRVPAATAADLLASPPADLVVLDVRTPEEFAEGHLAGAEILDFYRADFTDRLAELDQDVPYLLYCRSGNRSGQALAMMRELGFTDVTEIEGGVISWSQLGLPLVAG